jgi:hypothetical protein
MPKDDADDADRGGTSVARAGASSPAPATSTSCAPTEHPASEELGLVAEVAAGGDGGMLIRRVAALLAADFAGNFPACAASGPTVDGRLAVLVHSTATARGWRRR